jgi:methylmalonyl-CoA mutase, N-terminal domain
MRNGDDRFFSGAGFPIKRAYTPEDLPGFDYKKDLGFPGEAPFTRGIYPDMYRSRLWTIRRYSGFGTPEETNDLYRREYEMGQTGFSIAFDAPSVAGIDCDDPRAAADVGATGVPISSLEDMEILFRGLPIDKVATAIISHPMSSPPLTAMYFVMAEKRGLDLRALDGTTMNDITTALGCLYLADQVPPRYQIRFAIDFIEWCIEMAPHWHPVAFDSYNYREHEITAVQELGLLLATAICYTEEAKRRELDLNRFMRPFTFDMGCHNDFFEEIAKFRAARRLWQSIARERYGTTDPRCWQFRFHAQSSGCTHTTQEPFNNLVRIAYQVLACALGGAQSVHANGFDEGVCLPTENSMLLSIRTEQILQHETNITSTADPLGGSYYVEWLTNQVEEKTRAYIAEVEAQGGIVAALESGWVHREFFKAVTQYQDKLAAGEKVIIGVNQFRLTEEKYKVPVFRPNPHATEILSARIRELKRRRDNAQVERTLRRLREVTEAGENIMPPVMEAVRSYATLGEICNVWREIYGLWETPMRA